MASSSCTISPSRRLRLDLCSFPSEDETAEAPLLTSVLASLLERTIARSERAPAAGAASFAAGDVDARTRCFDSHRVLDMSIQSFMARFFRYAHVAPPVYVVAYVYMDRLCQLNPGLRICSTNVHRLLVTTILVASKFVEDINYCNSYFAKIGGLAAEELNSLELDFLFMMRFKLYVSVSVFESYCRHLEREVSYGGGYQIERSLRLMCSGEMMTQKRSQSKRGGGGVGGGEREGDQFNNLAHVL